MKTRPFQYTKDKPIIFISARVHPGETPGSFLMNSIIKFITDENDPRAEIMRKLFVFKVIPIINVDGVSRGNYRYDTNSLNMNRHYINPNQKIQPEIYAIKRIFLFYSQKTKVKYYYDLHAHASSKGLFLFGNNLDFLQQVENCILPKLIEINSENLNFFNCNFSERSMKTKERGDKFSKEGTGRVHFHKTCEIINSYTVEASYFRGLIKGNLPSFGKFFSFQENEIVLNEKNHLNSNLDFKYDSDKYLSIEDQSRCTAILIILEKYFKLNLKEFISQRLKKQDNSININNPLMKNITTYMNTNIIYTHNDKKNYLKTENGNCENKLEEIKSNMKNSPTSKNFKTYKYFLSEDKRDNNVSRDSRNSTKFNMIDAFKNDEENFKKYFSTNEMKLVNCKDNIDYNRKIHELFYDYKYSNEENLFKYECFPDEENFYTPISYEKMGVALLISILDYEGLNPFSRVFNSEYKDIKGIREYISTNIVSNEKYKGNLFYQNLNKNIQSVKIFKSLFDKYNCKIESKNNAFIRSESKKESGDYIDKEFKISSKSDRKNIECKNKNKNEKDNLNIINSNNTSNFNNDLIKKENSNNFLKKTTGCFASNNEIINVNKLTKSKKNNSLPNLINQFQKNMNIVKNDDEIKQNENEINDVNIRINININDSISKNNSNFNYEQYFENVSSLDMNGDIHNYSILGKADFEHKNKSKINKIFSTNNLNIIHRNRILFNKIGSLEKFFIEKNLKKKKELQKDMERISLSKFKNHKNPKGKKKDTDKKTEKSQFEEGIIFKNMSLKAGGFEISNKKSKNLMKNKMKEGSRIESFMFYSNNKDMDNIIKINDISSSKSSSKKRSFKETTESFLPIINK